MSILQVLGGLGSGYAKGREMYEDRKAKERNRLDAERDQQIASEFQTSLSNLFDQSPAATTVPQGGRGSSGPGQFSPADPVVPAPPVSGPGTEQRKGLTRLFSRSKDDQGQPLLPQGTLRADLDFNQLSDQYQSLRLKVASASPQSAERFQPALDSMRDIAMGKWREQFDSKKNDVTTPQGALEYARHMADGSARLGLWDREAEQQMFNNLLAVGNQDIANRNASANEMNARTARMNANTNQDQERRLANDSETRRNQDNAEAALGNMRKLVDAVTTGTVTTPEQVNNMIQSMNIPAWKGVTITDVMPAQENVNGDNLPGYLLTGTDQAGNPFQINTLTVAMHTAALENLGRDEKDKGESLSELREQYKLYAENETRLFNLSSGDVGLVTASNWDGGISGYTTQRNTVIGNIMPFDVWRHKNRGGPITREVQDWVLGQVVKQAKDSLSEDDKNHLRESLEGVKVPENRWPASLKTNEADK